MAHLVQEHLDFQKEGILIPARIRRSFLDQATQSGRPPNHSLVARVDAIVCTGLEYSAINASVAQHLDLVEKPTPAIPYILGVPVRCRVYTVSLEMDIAGSPRVIDHLDVIEKPLFPERQDTDLFGQPIDEIECVIGRDVLSHATLHLDGTRSMFSLFL